MMVLAPRDLNGLSVASSKVRLCLGGAALLLMVATGGDGRGLSLTVGMLARLRADTCSLSRVRSDDGVVVPVARRGSLVWL
jgi:hypothetical protein